MVAKRPTLSSEPQPNSAQMGEEDLAGSYSFFYVVPPPPHRIHAKPECGGAILDSSAENNSWTNQRYTLLSLMATHLGSPTLTASIATTPTYSPPADTSDTNSDDDSDDSGAAIDYDVRAMVRASPPRPATPTACWYGTVHSQYIVNMLLSPALRSSGGCSNPCNH